MGTVWGVRALADSTPMAPQRHSAAPGCGGPAPAHLSPPNPRLAPWATTRRFPVRPLNLTLDLTLCMTLDMTLRRASPAHALTLLTSVVRVVVSLLGTVEVLSFFSPIPRGGT